MMAVKAVRNRVLTVLLGISLLVPVMAAADDNGFARSPLFLNEPAADTMAFVLDDSASADFELLVPGTKKGAFHEKGFYDWLGRLLSDSDALEDVSALLLSDVRYGYVYEPGLVSGYDGRRINPDYHVVPPLSTYAFLRSAEWNPQYYNPNVDYEPWPYPVAGGELSMPQADTGDLQLDPLFPRRLTDVSTGSALLDAIYESGEFAEEVGDWLECSFSGILGNDCEVERSELDMQLRPFVVSGEMQNQLQAIMDTSSDVLTEGTVGLDPVSTGLEGLACGLESVVNNVQIGLGDGSLLNKRSICMGYDPAVYYVPVTEGTYKWRGDILDVFDRGQCDGKRSSDFADFVQNFNKEALKFEDENGNEFPGALAPDGTCLRKVNLAEEEEVADFVQERYGRSYEEELQNFANWFTYHRRRHQSLRAALGETAVKADNIRGLPVLTNSASGDLAMYDLQDRSADPVGDDGERVCEHGLDCFLHEMYTAYNDATADQDSPLRSTLERVGETFEQSGGDAPVAASCQQNIAGLYSDGYNTDGEITAVGNADGSAGEPFSDGTSGTLADVARHYYDELNVGGFDSGDVPVPDACSNDDPPPWLDCNRDLHLNTFGVTVGRRGANVWGQPMPGDGDGVYERRVDAHAEPPQWWPVTGSADEPGAAAQRDDLYHATVNGFGELFNAGNAAGAAASLNGAFNRPATLNAWESISTPEVVEISRREGLVYSASFNPREWMGRLTARRADLTASDSSDPQSQVLGEIIWDAGEVLNERDRQSNPRTLLTPRDDDTPGHDDGVVAFEPANFDALPEKARNDLLAGADPATARERMKYLAGDRRLEGEQFRERGGRLGDIVHSNPVHVGRPAMGWPDEAPYGTASDRYSGYLAQERDRERTVYVGANDGMLHAFDGTPDESGGGERFAYIPSFAFDGAESRGFSHFVSPEYQHRYSVDLAPAVSDVHIQTDPNAGSEWHTVLLGGMRTGGRGLFALDVTDPAVADSGSPEDLLLWEFQHPDLGILNKPVNVVLMPWGSGHEWVAVFGNGYNAPSGRSGVFMLRLEGGLDGAWTQGSDYRFIETASNGQPGVTSDVTPVDTDGDRVADRLYASDRDGRIWVLRESDGSWSAVSEPLFETPNGQPVTTGVTVARNRFVTDDDDNAPNLLVFFGTGQYLSNGDLRDNQTQSFYGVWDHGGTGLTVDQLQEQELSESVAGEVRVRSLSGDAIDWERGPLDEQGWYFDFDTRTGERVVYRPRLRNGQLRFTTIIPETAPCSAGGSSFRMYVDLDGSNPDEPPSDNNNDGEMDGPNAGSEHDDGPLSNSDDAGDVDVDNSTDQDKDEETQVTRTREPDTRRGRLGWQELVRPR